MEHYPKTRNLSVLLSDHETEERTARSEHTNLQARRGCRPSAPLAGSPATATSIGSTRAPCDLDFILQPPVRFQIEPHNVKPSATIRQRNEPLHLFLEADRELAKEAMVREIEVRVPKEQRRSITSRRRVRRHPPIGRPDVFPSRHDPTRPRRRSRHPGRQSEATEDPGSREGSEHGARPTGGSYRSPGGCHVAVSAC